MHSILKFFKGSFFASLSYKYTRIWYFYGQYKANGLGTNEKSYNIFDLRHWSKVAAHFQKKNKTFIYSFRYPNKESGKILQTEVAEPYLEPSKMSMIERFCENTTVKNYVIDVWYDTKHTPEVVQDPKINLKWMNTKMLEKTAHFFNVDFAEDILRSDIPRFQKQQFAHVLLNSRS